MAMIDSPARVAVLDIGKTNVKLNAVTLNGIVAETLSTPNDALDGPPWRHADLQGLGTWVFSELASLCRRHPIRHFITTGHGSGGVLTCADPDAPHGAAALPMIDYEQDLPDDVAAAYEPLAGGFQDRGSAIMQSSTHQARQMLWMMRANPKAFAEARWFLNIPQYWAWRLSGVAASEFSIMGAQSHLWNVAERRFSPIVASQGWAHLMPPFAHAGAALAPVRPALASRFGLPTDLAIHTGAHDSSTNFYRYQAAGFRDLVVVSTGTWIVALADRFSMSTIDERRSMTLNCDMDGNPLGGALTMGGREFSHVAGNQDRTAVADQNTINRLVARGTFALPTFGASSGQFEASAGHGKIAGPKPVDAGERLALAVLYVALLTVTCTDALSRGHRLIIDGSYLRDPAFGRLVATLRGESETLCNPESYGIASGAALLCTHHERTAPIPLDLEAPPRDFAFDTLHAYAARWKQLADGNLKKEQSP